MNDRSLFAPAPRRKRGLVLTLAGSLLFHGSLIGVAALWATQPKEPIPYGPTDIGDEYVLPDPPAIPTMPPVAPEDPVPPVMQVSEPVIDQPPLIEPNPDDMTLSTPVPRPAMARTPAHPSSAPVVARASSSHATGGPATAAASGSGAGRPGPAVRWNVPKPAYPAALRLARVQGSGSVRVTTDGTGRVVSAVIVQSTGSTMLDNTTCETAKTRWSGPANATTTVPITYRLD